MRAMTGMEIRFSTTESRTQFVKKDVLDSAVGIIEAFHFMFDGGIKSGQLCDLHNQAEAFLESVKEVDSQLSVTT